MIKFLRFIPIKSLYLVFFLLPASYAYSHDPLEFYFQATPQNISQNDIHYFDYVVLSYTPVAKYIKISGVPSTLRLVKANHSCSNIIPAYSSCLLSYALHDTTTENIKANLDINYQSRRDLIPSAGHNIDSQVTNLWFTPDSVTNIYSLQNSTNEFNILIKNISSQDTDDNLSAKVVMNGQADISINQASSCLNRLDLLAGATCQYQLNYVEKPFSINQPKPNSQSKIISESGKLTVSANDQGFAEELSYPFMLWHVSKDYFLNIPVNITGFDKISDSSFKYVTVDRFGHFYAVGNDGDLSISMNDGTTWYSYTTSNGIPSVTVNNVDAFLHNVYIATSAGLMETNDNGSTWKKLSNDSFSSQNIQDVAVDNNVIAAGTDHGLMLSDDYGQTWHAFTTKQGLIDNDIKSIYIDQANSFSPFANESIVLGTAQGLSISFNSGLSWKNLTTSNGLQSNKVNQVILTTTHIYAATSKGLSISDISANHWNTQLNGQDVLSVYASDDPNSAIYAGTEQGLLQSRDQGASWQKVNAIGQQHVYAISQFDCKIAVATNQGVYISKDDGLTWQQYSNNNNMLNASIHDINTFNNILFVATETGLDVSYDNGKKWQNYNDIHKLPSSFITSLNNYNNHMYIGTTAGLTILDHTNDSWIWTEITSGLIDNHITAVFADNNGLFVGTAAGLSYSTDFGVHWSTITTSQGIIDDHINKLTSAANNQLLIATPKGISIGTLVNNQWSWRNITTLQGLDSANVLDIISSSNAIYAATDKGLNISSDQGSTWKECFVAVNNATINNIFIAVNSIYLATSDGVYISHDKGGSWIHLNNQSGLGDTSDITSLLYSGHNIYAGSKHGLFYAVD